MSITEQEIQRLQREEGRRFKLRSSTINGIEGNFRYEDLETSVVFVTVEQEERNRIATEQQLSSFNNTSEQPSAGSSMEESDPLERIRQQEAKLRDRAKPDSPNALVSNIQIDNQTAPQYTPPRPTVPPGQGALRDSILPSLMVKSKKDFLENYPQENAQKNSGFYNKRIIEPSPTYNSTEAEKVIQNNNCFIILGRDRPRSEASGKGATANTHTACIDIIAGMNGVLAREVDNKGEPVLSNKSPELDSARIYISQRADIDSSEYFNLARGSVGNITNRSAIAVKADSVRIIGREGIKLVTSTDTYNGASGMYIGDNIQGIDLIAGNDDSDLQPMVKGDTLAKVLEDLTDMLSYTHNQVDEAFAMIMKLTLLLSTTSINASNSPIMNEILLDSGKFIVNQSRIQKNFPKLKLNFSSTLPGAKYNFRSKYNHVN